MRRMGASFVCISVNLGKVMLHPVSIGHDIVYNNIIIAPDNRVRERDHHKFKYIVNCADTKNN